MDEDGDRLFDEDGEPAESIDIKYNITNEMIRYALEEYEFDVRKNGQIVNRSTWKKNCQQFLEDVKQVLERDRCLLSLNCAAKHFQKRLFLPIRRHIV